MRLLDPVLQKLIFALIFEFFFTRLKTRANFNL